jgi:hypothetical protein
MIWKMENGKWKMENGKWKLEIGNVVGADLCVRPFTYMSAHY